MFHLVIQTGKNKGRKIAIPDREVAIGRDEGCLVRLASTEVSRRHCAIKPTPNGPLVRDLGSQNGTVVNNEIIQGERLLQPGDYLQVGPIQFQLTSDQQPKPKPNFEDDAIAGWLSDGDSAGPSVSDTTIVKATDLKSIHRNDPKATFDTLAEEAQDIIRRHVELKQQE